VREDIEGGQALERGRTGHWGEKGEALKCEEGQERHCSDGGESNERRSNEGGDAHTAVTESRTWVRGSVLREENGFCMVPRPQGLTVS
jgi:hypothetical protein